VRVPSTLVHSPSSGSIFKHEYLNHKGPSLVPPFTHLNGTPSRKFCQEDFRYRVKLYLPDSVRKTFNTGLNCIRPSRSQAANHRLWYHLLGNPRGQNRGDLTRMRTEPNPHKTMTPHSIQNLKTLGLWIFFLIRCSNFSFLLNVRLGLTFEYLSLKWMSWEKKIND